MEKMLDFLDALLQSGLGSKQARPPSNALDIVARQTGDLDRSQQASAALLHTSGGRCTGMTPVSTMWS